MDDPETPPELPVDLKRRNAQRLFALGYISQQDYDALGRLHGFVSPAPRTPGAKLRIGLSMTGYLLLLGGALAEIVATRHPEYRGPLEGLLEIARIISQGLGQ